MRISRLARLAFYALCVVGGFLYVLLLARCASAPKAVQLNDALTGDVYGCLVTFGMVEGTATPFYEPFLKVGDKDYDSEDGAAEVWGFRMWHLEDSDQNGKTHPVNVLASKFIAVGETKKLPSGFGSDKIVRCPKWGGKWGTASQPINAQP